MPSLQSLTRQIQQVCSQYRKQLRQTVSKSGMQSLLPMITSSTSASANFASRGGSLRGFREGAHPTIVVVVTVLSLTSTLGHRYYNQPLLDVGKVAPQMILAPGDATIEDKKATEEKRKTARTVAITVLAIDQRINDQIRQDLQNAIARGTSFRQLAGAFPFVETKVLSTQAQRYLRKAPEADWQQILQAAQEQSAAKQATKRGDTPPRPKIRLSDPLQRQIANELQNYLQVNSPRDFSILTDQINDVRRQYAGAVSTLQDPSAQSVSLYDASLLELSETDWQDFQTQISQVNDRILAQGISPGLPKNLLEGAVNLHIQSASPQSKGLAAKLLMTYLQPNLVRDEEQSRLKAEQAAQEVQPEIVTIRRGEVIVPGGQVISQRDFVLLDYFNLSRRQTNWSSFVGFGCLVGGSVALFWWVERRFHPKGLRNRDYVLVWLLALSSPVLVMLGVPATNLPAIGLLIGSFYGPLLAVTSVGLLSTLLPVGMAIGVSHWLPSVAGGLLAAFWGGKLRSREELALLGVAVGITQGALYLLLSVASGIIWYDLLGATAIYGLLGLAWSIVAIGISPYLEHLFDLVTTIRLVELANPNRPLLKRLAAETPGTFQHTLFVATLAEAAARELGCNVELVRTGTLYHDIGKTHDPQGFIENQMGAPNKHDLIDDPWKSAAIIKKHVTEGIVMARKARLPRAVQSFIPEHQGKMLIAYFYHQAKQKAEQDPTKMVNDDDFRYDGPDPQSRETGIVMLADSCEAALRSLKDATREEAMNMINKILRARWQEGQLSESGLTREEIGTIARVFVNVWQQSNHQRIAYPKLAK
ncbi:HD family phosphohydrolase [Phormidesmis priestleyi]